MTAAIGRFPLIEPETLGTADEVDCSREAWPGPPVGVLYSRGVPILTLSPDLVISTRSSSSSLATPFNFDEGSGLLCSSHFAFGCMVTWSTDLEVFFKISLTYLGGMLATG
jgi:hypothetical protein